MNQHRRKPAPLDWKPAVAALVVVLVVAGLVAGFVRWAAAVDLMQANTNAGCCGG